MSKDSSPKYYQNNKEKLQKKGRDSKEKKFYQKMKKKSFLSIEKNIIK